MALVSIDRMLHNDWSFTAGLKPQLSSSKTIAYGDDFVYFGAGILFAWT